MHRAQLTTATFEAPKPMLRVVTELLEELIENGDSYARRPIDKWSVRFKELADRLLDESVNAQDSLLLIATNAITAALQLQEDAA